jgi:hypothetical protein
MCDSEAGPEETNVGMFMVGVFISIAGSTANNAGVNLQKLSITRELKKPEHDQRPYVLQPFWSIGLLGIIIGAVADSLALGFAAASVVTPVGGFTIVANVRGPPVGRVCVECAWASTSRWLSHLVVEL